MANFHAVLFSAIYEDCLIETFVPITDPRFRIKSTVHERRGHEEQWSAVALNLV